MYNTDKSNKNDLLPDSMSRGAHTLSIITNERLWEFLFPKQTQIVTVSTRKLTKAEAFVDLINRHRLASATHDNTFLQGTAVSLSKAWGWDRTTVKKYLSVLEEIGAITMQSIGFHKTFIRLQQIFSDE